MPVIKYFPGNLKEAVCVALGSMATVLNVKTLSFSDLADTNGLYWDPYDTGCQ